MKPRLLLIVLSAFVALAAKSQPCPPPIQWERSYGGSGYEYITDVQALPDGGYVLGGSSLSLIGNGRASTNYGGYDIWLVRIDASGQRLWEQSLGGSDDDGLSSVQRTADGGFLVGGFSTSPADGIKTSPNRGRFDYWVVRLDADGNPLWDVSLGGSRDDFLTQLRTTEDGGCIVVGGSDSSITGTKTAPNHGRTDLWVVRLDANGRQVWEQDLGGALDDSGAAVVATPDGGFAIAGFTAIGLRTDYQGWLVRLDAGGNRLWDRPYGGSGLEYFTSLIQTPDGDFILGGPSSSPPGPAKGAPLFGGTDFWIVRTDAQGIRLWDQSFGGTEDEYLKSLLLLPDGGVAAGGNSRSGIGGSKTSPLLGFVDSYVVRLRADGTLRWDRTLGGSGEEDLTALRRSGDGGLLLGGLSTSTDGDRRSGRLSDGGDYWVVQLVPERADDCDYDGVPDDRDRCPETVFGSVVNADGCSVAQACPCNGDWASQNEYVRCVQRAAKDLRDLGRLSEAQRRETVAQARLATCGQPAEEDGVVTFGLLHQPLGDALLDDPSGNGPLYVSDYEDSGGVSVQLGEADSGVFIAPTAQVDGEQAVGNQLTGIAYGKVGGRDDIFISAIQAYKSELETFPVRVDLSGLAPESVTLQILEGEDLVSETTETGSMIGFTVVTSSGTSPRANPLWRRPDGSIGAIIEFNSGNALGGNIAFVRANNPGRKVDFVSRVDALAAGGLAEFVVLEEQLGMFGREHRALGRVRFGAQQGRLQLSRLSGDGPDFAGVGVKLDRTHRFDLLLDPLVLTTESAALQIAIRDSLPGLPFAQIGLDVRSNAVALSAEFLGWSEGVPFPELEIRVYRNGALAGTDRAPNAALAGTISGRGGRPVTLVGIGSAASETQVQQAAFAFRQTVLFTGPTGQPLEGNLIEVRPLQPQARPAGLASFSLAVVKLPGFTIVGESSDAPPPALALSRSASDLQLSWPLRTAPFRLEVAPAWSMEFLGVTEEVDVIDGRSSVTLPFTPDGASRFFRLSAPVP